MAPAIILPMQTQALPGFRDFYPADLALRDYIFRTWRQVAGRYGFEEYDGPPLEPLELYTAKSGEEIVGQLYSFIDKGGREVSLRPEMTPTLARMVAARANGLKKPIRWFSIPQLFRYERQQRGRLREHFQLNCDLIGEAGHLADAEIVALAIDAVRAFGLRPKDIRVRLSDRRLLSALLGTLGVSEAQTATVYQVFDKLRRTPEEVSLRRLVDGGLNRGTAELLLGLARARSWDRLAGVDSSLRGVLGEGDSLRRTFEALRAMGFGDYLDLDLGIVRGLAYYTGIVFEAFDAGRKLRAICGGGRYDGLLAALGGPALPAVGFGFGDVVIQELLADLGLLPEIPRRIDAVVVALGPGQREAAIRLASALRAEGASVELVLGQPRLKRALADADRAGARRAYLLGAEEIARGAALVRDLATGEQSERPLPVA